VSHLELTAPVTPDAGQTPEPPASWARKKPWQGLLAVESTVITSTARVDTSVTSRAASRRRAVRDRLYRYSQGLRPV